jgi:uncharacterized protein (UPF0548 family)
MASVSSRQRLATAATWPVGIALTSWAYLWRTTPVHRHELVGSRESDAPPALPEDAGDEIQAAAAGVGTLFHRRYRMRIRDSTLTPDALMGAVMADLNAAAPTSFARFVRTSGDEGSLHVGDELVVRMPGPWDGPVRVVAVDPASFTLATLDGHLEAGQIRFSASRAELLEFEIEAWARSGDRLSNVLYAHLRMAKEVQLHMWVSFLEGVARLAGGRMSGGVEIETWRLEDERADDPPRGSEGIRRELAELRTRDLNFDPVTTRPHTTEAGWHVDDFSQDLPSEPPGPPLADGSFAAAVQLVRDYAFADPAVVRPYYDPDEALEQRTMLLAIRYYGLRMHVGVRVLDVYERELERGGRRAHVWGWSYGTLEGHFEMGKLDWQVWKWLDTGEVQFRTHAYSRRAKVANPFIRLGFRAVGRHEQLDFMRSTRRRMALLTAHALAGT